MTNALSNALSPYLLQHAEQPVHWQEWTPETLAMARRVDRPILLSIGYSACHWCHVMAEECFENEALAERMNRDFVNIKVDREERPDLDRIYQLAHQLLTGRGGGWPLTVFLDPQSLAPFFAGTYFPPEPRRGLIGFGQLLERIHAVWTDRREELTDQQRQVRQALNAIAQPRQSEAGASVEELAETLMAQLASRFDARHGGFGSAPKFPQVPVLSFLAARSGDEQAEQMLSDTLEAIVRHGLQDQIGGGFFRYCVDQAWEIPHFEKMLSDNAQLLGVLAEAAARWPHRRFRDECEYTVDWLRREMQLEGGGFAASLDADSEDGEGGFYLWTRKQVEQALPKELAELAAEVWGLDGPPNFGDRRWHLIRARAVEELGRSAEQQPEIEQRIAQARTALREAREAELSPPARDDKLIGAWNGLTIEALSRAGRLLSRPEWRVLAAEGLDAVAPRLFGHEPPRSIWRDGRAAQIANLDDHANVLLACLELLSWRFEPRWFNLARRIARRIQQQFVDPDNGACYFTPLDQSGLLTRPLAFADDATLAGAAQAVRGLIRLSHLSGDPALIRDAEWIVTGASGDMASSPVGHAGLVTAALELAAPGTQVLIGGPGPEPAQWLAAIAARPGLRSYRLEPGQHLDEAPELLKSIADFDRPTAIVCCGLRCLAPAHDLVELEQRLADASG
ncbi:thioredoxin domain-containing protein [Wenzhouxiangella marina]|uniref:Thioredoxin n=1 Tax=Wenzhouxiangella marina TaxID=1579979 RepID=A0A0K0XSU0_9GAMM|nr:thioredoxin domain-containing protein [Wenzhouxiangella marina]AKS40720.1 thioredoxin [Wenzhouxiangella marina]MBB6087593.1 hypothetical protein [Wenzhouxiangella marina]